MNLIDSSGWLAYFLDTPNGKFFAKPIQDTGQLLVPSIVIYEVFKKIIREFGRKKALQSIAQMKLGRLIDLDLELALVAAKISNERKLAMADSIILATAESYKATLWTQDVDFKGMKGVKYFRKKTHL